jgi:peptidoglycan/LPS O-acetylase OafA/YrhL
MTLSYWERPIEATGKEALKFSLKKIKPLFHLHVIMLFFGLLIGVLTTHSSWSAYIAKLVITIPLLQTWFPKWYQALNSVDWYLSVTLFLYFAFPFLLMFLQKKELDTKKSLLLIAWVYFLQLIIGALVGYFFSSFTQWITYCFPIYRLGDFFIGCILGNLYRKNGTATIKRPVATIVELSIVLIIFASWFAARTVLKEYNWLTYTCLFVPSSACLIFFFAKEEGWLSKAIINRITLYFAGLSAYFFLIHRQVLYYVDCGIRYCFSIKVNRWVLAIIAFPITLLAVKIYLLLQEKFYTKSLK